jgi:hypothetical protein
MIRCGEAWNDTLEAQRVAWLTPTLRQRGKQQIWASASAGTAPGAGHAQRELRDENEREH